MHPEAAGHCQLAEMTTASFSLMTYVCSAAGQTVTQVVPLYRAHKKQQEKLDAIRTAVWEDRVKV